MSPVAIDSHNAEGVVYLLSSLETLKAIVTQMARQQAKSRLRVFGKGGEPFLEGEKQRVRLLTRRVHSPSLGKVLRISETPRCEVSGNARFKKPRALRRRSPAQTLRRTKDTIGMEVSQMPQQWNWLNIPMRPALPPPPATADVYEPAGGEAYIIEMHVAGVKPEEIAIEATPDRLRVSTDPQQPQDSGRRYIWREQEIRPWSRLFEFPMAIDTDKVRATLENGILKIYAPKALAGQRKVIHIGESGETGQAA
jgi:HSP20 family molecular chaperone IbpA